MISYTIRNYQPVDFDKYAMLYQKATRLDPGRRSVSLVSVAERLDHPNCSPEQDIFVCEAAEGIIGYIDVVPELGIGRVVLNCWLEPEHRKKGLASRLLDSALPRAREMGAKVAHVNIAEDNIPAKTALARLGFRYVRRFLEYELDLAGFYHKRTNREAQECRPLGSDEKDKLTHIQNLAFAEHWGYNPNTPATTTHYFYLNRRSPEDVFLAYEDDRVIGFCWTETISYQEGRIFMLGVAPDCRSRGTGRRLLFTGLSHLKSKGLRVAVLTVDSENKKACTMYRSTGFRLRTSSLWYEKAVL